MNYYNEFDPKAAAWLRELIKRGLIPKGDVDERSITEVLPADLVGYTQCHFFAGIAGWALALKLAGWSEDRPVWTGSCPCQPWSLAGLQLGQADARHLWPVWFNLIRQCRPECVFGEQVASAIGKGWLDGISADLEGEGYACGAVVLGAHSVGAPHIRQRLYWVANSNNERPQGRTGVLQCSNKRTSGARCMDGGMEHTTSDGREQRRPESSRGCVVGGCGEGAWNNFDVIPCLDGKARRIESGSQCMAYGLPYELDGRWDCCTNKIQEKINLYAATTKTSSGQVLRVLLETLQPKFLQWSSGGFISLQTEAVLFASLCKLSRKLGKIIDSDTQGSAEEPKGAVREMRKGWILARSSFGRESHEQFGVQFNDLVCGLSQEVASIAEEIAPRIIHSFPLSATVPGRVGLLRGYGNAIIPPLAAEFIKATGLI